jgi:hypothetical protein
MGDAVPCRIDHEVIAIPWMIVTLAHCAPVGRDETGNFARSGFDTSAMLIDVGAKGSTSTTRASGKPREDDERWSERFAATGRKSLHLLRNHPSNSRHLKSSTAMEIRDLAQKLVAGRVALAEPALDEHGQTVNPADRNHVEPEAVSQTP